MVKRLSKKEVEEVEKKITNYKKKNQEKKRKKGRPGTYEDFLSEAVTQEEKDKYLAAIKMGDTEYKLGVKGYPKPQGVKKNKNKAKGGYMDGNKFVARQYGGKIGK